MSRDSDRSARGEQDDNHPDVQGREERDGDDKPDLPRLMAEDAHPGEGAEGQRGRAGSPKRVVLPDGWLNSRTSEGVDYSELVEAERQGLGGDGG